MCPEYWSDMHEYFELTELDDSSGVLWNRFPFRAAVCLFWLSTRICQKNGCSTAEVIAARANLHLCVNVTDPEVPFNTSLEYIDISESGISCKSFLCISHN